MNIPQFATKEELFAHLRANKNLYTAARKGALKYADAVECHLIDIDSSNDTVIKAAINPNIADMEKFNVKAVINTTNLMDSHSDVHIPGLWNKSLKEQKNLYLLQEHQMSFKSIISDTVNASAHTISWSKLGFNYPGSTQALIFDASVEKNRNEFMSEQYAKDRVKNHSVGMRYVKLELAMNSDSKYDQQEKAAWDKYITQVANKEVAEEQGYFWAVTEAKVIEGSAVPLGSNFATPTISVGKEADIITSTEPPAGTQKTGYELFKY